jgi:3-phosphoshikimate 1-carboxyvinyltransferase
LSRRVIRPAANILGALRLPGDKSISHRYAMLAGLAQGPSKFHNFSTGADCASTLACLLGLGVKVEHDRNSHTVTIEGRSGQFSQPSTALDCGNSGSSMRMLSGILSGQALESELIGDESLSRRPMARVIEPLTQMGAQIEAREGNKAPLRIRGGKLRPIEYKPKVASAQVKSALLFAGLQAEGETAIEEPHATRDHGELALRAFGAEVKRSQNRVSIQGGQKLRGLEAMVPGDASSASFFFCAAALFPESNLVIEGLLMNPTRASLLDVMATLGAKPKVLQLEEQHGELVGTVKIESGKLGGALIEGAQSAALIDELPVLAAIAPYTRDGIEIRDARELRVKESDRIALVAKNLRAMGATVEEREDGLRVPGQQQLYGAEIDPAGDHRIAMAFTIAALRAQGDTVITDSDAAGVSFPEFYELLDGVLER